MSTPKIIISCILGLALFIDIMFVLELGGLEWKKFFAPKHANVERKVFEETKSFTHGKIQDLAKYYEEYSKAEVSDRESIRQFIIMNFAEFDSENITNQKLKDFLVTQRGY